MHPTNRSVLIYLLGASVLVILLLVLGWRYRRKGEEAADGYRSMSFASTTVALGVVAVIIAGVATAVQLIELWRAPHVIDNPGGTDTPPKQTPMRFRLLENQTARVGGISILLVSITGDPTSGQLKATWEVFAPGFETQTATATNPGFKLKYTANSIYSVQVYSVNKKTVDFIVAFQDP